MTYPKSLLEVLLEEARPVFLFGSTPPREGTTVEKARETCEKFAARSSVLATDGFIVYDIQDEGARTAIERPFPFRKTMDPSLYASFFPEYSGKECIVYKCVTEETEADFDQWLNRATDEFGHNCFTLVGAASSKDHRGLHMSIAGARTKRKPNCNFGCVSIPERHLTKKNENQNMINKIGYGAEWFITQGIFDSEPIIKLLNEYGDSCRQHNIIPKKVILTFAPCGRPKTMKFIRWLGMQVPEEVEHRIFQSANPVQESTLLLNELLIRILQQTSHSGVPIGLNVESLSIFKEEINAAHDLFQSLQATLLTQAGSPWAVRWYYVGSLSSRSSYANDSKDSNYSITRSTTPLLLNNDILENKKLQSTSYSKNISADAITHVPNAVVAEAYYSESVSQVRTGLRQQRAYMSTSSVHHKSGQDPINNTEDLNRYEDNSQWAYTTSLFLLTAVASCAIGITIGRNYNFDFRK